MTDFTPNMTKIELYYDNCGTNYDKGLRFVIIAKNMYFCLVLSLF